MIKLLPKYIIRFVVLVLVQVFILNNVHLGGFINPYIYILFIITLPFETPKWFLLLIAFLLGFTIDIFSHTPGMHSSATVFMAFFRVHLLEVISPRDGYENETTPSIKDYGGKWFFKYTIVLVLLHHVFLFYAEVFSLTNFFTTLGRALLSAAFSIGLIMIIQYFYKK
ncbi:MAG: rod shape-determining protein MreD [Bacteroidales bacterium]|jgi:hypothetical protein|nr:rod shape-determining protein MreD [Bacteroidales bacterium]